MEANNSWINTIWFSDEAHFYLNGVINSQNTRYWGTSNPLDENVIGKSKANKGKKCTAWVALSSKGIIGPYWFENSSGNSETVNQDNYQPVVRRFVDELKEKGLWTSRTWFQQDGATCHTALATLDVLKELFGSRVISLKTRHIWSPNSPDMNPLDFFLWGYAKDNVYRNRPRTISDLKKEVEDFIGTITPMDCKKVIGNFATRVNRCLVKKGSHIEHIISLKNL